VDLPETLTRLGNLEGSLLSLLQEVRTIKGEIQNGDMDQNSYKEDHLLIAKELADRLKVPRSWVYEQSRQGKIPTHRVGRYIRFNIQEILASQKKD